MTSKEILEKFISFYTKRGHALVPNVSLVPENDPTLLYVNSGMFPLVPYLSGEPHPLGKRLVNVQRCLRFFEDLENVGVTNRHTIAFHMLGNWGLGDYFKKEQLFWMYELYIEVFGLDVNKIYATVFSGNKSASKDTESIDILKQIFSKYEIEAKEGERIFETEKDNWWKRGDAIGELGGPSSEIFYYIGKDSDGFGKNILEHEDEFIEIGNSVFMQYKKIETGWEELPQKNVDFGGGLERIALCTQKKSDIYQTDNFFSIIQKLEELSGKPYGDDKAVTKAMRAIADHMRAATFLAMDGVVTSNKELGYVLRRLIRRMVRSAKVLDINSSINLSQEVVPVVADMFSWLYPDLIEKQRAIQDLFSAEEEKFEKVLAKGARQVSNFLEKFDGPEEELAQKAFDFYQSLGYPEEIFIEDVKEANITFDEVRLLALCKKCAIKHQAESRTGAEQRFKGGLADHSEEVIKYHTATHIIHMALRQTLGEHVMQKGSNITKDRLRFDFNHPLKLTEEQITQVETLVNNTISKALPVNFEILPTEKAKKTGALHVFNEKYGEKVKVYYIGESLETAISKEFCGGPHVQNLSELAPIKIYKQQAIGDDKQRIYASFAAPTTV